MIIRIPVTAFTLEIVLRNLHTWKTVLATFTVTAATSFLCAFPLYITPAQYEERKTIHCLGKKTFSITLQTVCFLCIWCQ